MLMHVCTADDVIPANIHRFADRAETVLVWHTEDLFSDDIVAWVTFFKGVIYEFQASECGDSVLDDVETWAREQGLHKLSMKIQLCKNDPWGDSLRSIKSLNFMMGQHGYKITDLCYMGDGLSISEFLLTKDLTLA